MSLIFDKDYILSMNFLKSPNKILIKPTRGENEIILPGGIKIFLDNRFSKERHAPTTGTIVKTCGTPVPERMQWETPNEIQEGDYCVYSYEAAMYALDPVNSRLFVDHEGDAYFILDYEDLFVVKRGDHIIPVNGYLLVSPIEEKTDSAFKILRTDNNSATMGTVAHVGVRNSRYLYGSITRDDVFDGEENISPGDVIVFNANSDLPVEYDLHKSLAKNANNFFRLQRRDIEAIIPASEKKKYGF